MFELIFLLWSLQDLKVPPTKTHIDLIQQLGNDSYEIRESSYNKLKELDNEARVAIEQYGLNHSDIEIRRRCEFLLEEFYDHGVTPPCTTLYQRNLIHLKEEKTLEISPDSAKFWFEMAGGNSSYEIYEDVKMQQLQLGTKLYLDQLRKSGYAKEEIQMIIEKLKVDRRAIYWYDLYENRQ